MRFDLCSFEPVWQIENLVVMARLFGRTLVMPDHLCNRMDHLRSMDFHTIGEGRYIWNKFNDFVKAVMPHVDLTSG